MAIDLTRSRLVPFGHQAIGSESIVLWDNPPTGRVHGGAFALLDEMGAGKTKQEIDAAQVLFVEGAIKRVITIAPASVVDVWFNPEFGELRKHLWEGLPVEVILYRPSMKLWYNGSPKDPNKLQWFITNYELIRGGSWLRDLLPYADKKTQLVCDEASAIRNWKAEQTKAVYELRQRVGRIVPLNGTPIANSNLDLFALGNMMHPGILECRFITHFRAKYCEMGGFQVQTKWGKKMPTKIIGWKNVEELQQRFAPYVLRRLKKDCLDLPPVLDPVTRTATLDDSTWTKYKAMRDDMVVWLTNTEASQAQQAITKVLRLAQITSGFLGGVEDILADEGAPEWAMPNLLAPTGGQTKVIEISREKLDLLLEQIPAWLEDDRNLKLLTWVRFLPELPRLFTDIAHRFPQFELGCVAGKAFLGGSKTTERAAAMRLLDPASAPPGPVFVAGTYGTGSLGLNFTACHTVANLSFDTSYYKFVQGAARVDRPGQLFPVSTFDFIAQGPKGQKTIDHVIVNARRSKENMAEWTTSKWVSVLTEE